jgi:CheY-like chemotaxis protein
LNCLVSTLQIRIDFYGEGSFLRPSVSLALLWANRHGNILKYRFREPVFTATAGRTRAGFYWKGNSIRKGAFMKKTVLLVDDDLDLLDTYKTILEHEGFAVLTATDSAEAMKLAASNPIDVAVLDVMMETPTEGFELAREMRQNEKTKRIALLMLTSVNTHNEEIGSFVRFTDSERDNKWLPVDRFLDKPVKPKDLVTIVRTLSGAWSFSR